MLLFYNIESAIDTKNVDGFISKSDLVNFFSEENLEEKDKQDSSSETKGKESPQYWMKQMDSSKDGFITLVQFANTILFLLPK